MGWTTQGPVARGQDDRSAPAQDTEAGEQVTDVRDELADLFGECLASGSPPFDDYADRAIATVNKECRAQGCEAARMVQPLTLMRDSMRTEIARLRVELDEALAEVKRLRSLFKVSS